MGKSLKKIAAVVAPTAWFGTQASISGTKKAAALMGMSTSKNSSNAAIAATSNSLAQERDENAKKRVRLYATEHGELGEEVNSVGISGNRGKIFS